MLSTAAFNALLKTLEEPPEHVVFVLCTTDPHKVPETIQSRCQRFDFRRFSIEEITGYLERISNGEGYTYEPEALEYIAAKSAGGMRDATTALEQVGVYTGGNITLDEAARMFGQIDAAALFEIAGYIACRDTPSCFIWINNLVGKGVDLAQFSRDLASHLRNLYVTAITGGENGIVACTASQLAQYQEQAQQFGGIDRLSRALDICGALVNELRSSSDPRLSVEIAMTRLTRPESELTLEALAERIETIERQGVAPVMQAAPSIEPQPIPVAEPMAEPMEEFHAEEFVETSPEVQPEPVQQPEPIHGSYNGIMTNERLLSAILSVIRREDEATAGFMNGIALERNGDRYRILFPVGSEFQLKLVQGAETQELIGRAFAESLGSPVEFECALVGSPADDAWTAKADNDGSVMADAAPVAGGMPAEFADALSAFGTDIKFEEIGREE